MIRLFCC